VCTVPWRSLNTAPYVQAGSCIARARHAAPSCTTLEMASIRLLGASSFTAIDVSGTNFFEQWRHAGRAPKVGCLLHPFPGSRPTLRVSCVWLIKNVSIIIKLVHSFSPCRCLGTLIELFLRIGTWSSLQFAVVTTSPFDLAQNVTEFVPWRNDHERIKSSGVGSRYGGSMDRVD